MNTNKVLLATLAGGVSFFILGFLFYAVLFASFFEANRLYHEKFIIAWE